MSTFFRMLAKSKSRWPDHPAQGNRAAPMFGTRHNGVCEDGEQFLRKVRSIGWQEGARRVIAALEGPGLAICEQGGPRRVIAALEGSGLAICEQGEPRPVIGAGPGACAAAVAPTPPGSLATQRSENARRRPLPSDLRWHCAPRADRASCADRRPARAGR